MFSAVHAARLMWPGGSLVAVFTLASCSALCASGAFKIKERDTTARRGRKYIYKLYKKRITIGKSAQLDSSVMARARLLYYDAVMLEAIAFQ